MLITHELKDGEPCHHAGCAHHRSHPCEVCGRIEARGYATLMQHDCAAYMAHHLKKNRK